MLEEFGGTVASEKRRLHVGPCGTFFFFFFEGGRFVFGLTWEVPDLLALVTTQFCSANPCNDRIGRFYVAISTMHKA